MGGEGGDFGGVVWGALAVLMRPPYYGEVGRGHDGLVVEEAPQFP